MPAPAISENEPPEFTIHSNGDATFVFHPSEIYCVGKERVAAIKKQADTAKMNLEDFLKAKPYLRF